MSLTIFFGLSIMAAFLLGALVLWLGYRVGRASHGVAAATPYHDGRAALPRSPDLGHADGCPKKI